MHATHTHAPTFLIWQVHRDLLYKEYANFFKGQAYSLARYGASHLLEMTRWHLTEYVRHVSSSECNHASLVEFVRGPLLATGVHMDVLAHGNVSAAQARPHPHPRPHP